MTAVARTRIILICLLHELTTAGRFLVAILRRKPIVLVHQMGKVGSSAVDDALRAAGIASFHTHRLDRRHMAEVRRRNRLLGFPRNPEMGRFIPPLLRLRSVVPVVTLVREPIARNLSAFAQNLREQDRRASGPELLAAFVRDYPHDTPDRWMRVELVGALAVDPWTKPFDHARGWSVIDHPRHPTLVLRSELDDRTKGAALADFVGRNVEVSRANVGGDKSSASTYRALRRQAEHGLPDHVIDTALGGPVAAHFLGDEEREAARSRWSAAFGE